MKYLIYMVALFLLSTSVWAQPSGPVICCPKIEGKVHPAVIVKLKIVEALALRLINELSNRFKECSHSVSGPKFNHFIDAYLLLKLEAEKENIDQLPEKSSKCGVEDSGENLPNLFCILDSKFSNELKSLIEDPYFLMYLDATFDLDSNTFPGIQSIDVKNNLLKLMKQLHEKWHALQMQKQKKKKK